MQRNFFEELRFQFRSGSILTKLIFVNGVVFLVMVILALFLFLSNTPKQFISETILSFFAPNAELIHNITHPWGIPLYMFLHISVLHLLFQMMILYFTGKIFLEYLDEKKLLNTYIFGGLSGLLFYILALNLFPVFEGREDSYLHGASASTMALLVALSFHLPQLEINLFGAFKMRLIVVALVFIAIDLIAIPNDNRGARMAHIGGAVYGIWAAGFFRNPKHVLNRFDLTDFFSPERWFKRKTKMKVKHSDFIKKPISDEKFNELKAGKQKRIDAILEKIHKSGYESLTKEEKDFLFNASNDV